MPSDLAKLQSTMTPEQEQVMPAGDKPEAVNTPTSNLDALSDDEKAFVAEHLTQGS